MRHVLPALWGGLRDLARPRMLWLALLPALVAVLACSALLLAQWEGTIAYVHRDLLQTAPVDWVVARAEAAGHGGLRTVIGPALMLVGWIPAVLAGSLLLTSWALAPRLLRQQGVAPVARDPWRLLRGAGVAAVFLFVWLATVPVWLLPFGLLLPVLLWAWLLSRVTVADAVALRVPAAAREAAADAVRWPGRALALLLAVLSLVPLLVLAVPVWATMASAHLVARAAPPGGWSTPGRPAPPVPSPSPEASP